MPYIIKSTNDTQVELTLAQELLNFQCGYRCYLDGKLLPKDKWKPLVMEINDGDFIYTIHETYPYGREIMHCCASREINMDLFTEHWNNALLAVTNENKAPLFARDYGKPDPLTFSYRHVSVPQFKWTFMAISKAIDKGAGCVIFDADGVFNFTESQYVHELRLQHFSNFSQFSQIAIYWAPGKDSLLPNTYKYISSDMRYFKMASIKNRFQIADHLQTIRGDPKVEDSCIICAGKCYEYGYVLHGVVGIPSSIFLDHTNITQDDILRFRSVMVCYACLSVNYRKLQDICHSIIVMPTVHKFGDYLESIDPIKRNILKHIMQKKINLAESTYITVDGQKYYLAHDGDVLCEKLEPDVKFIYVKKI